MVILKRLPLCVLEMDYIRVFAGSNDMHASGFGCNF